MKSIQKSNQIGTRNESSLHSQIKKWYSIPGDKLESKIDNYIVDIVRNDLLIEIQTKNFSAIGSKIMRLLKNHNVRLVYPIAEIKWIKKFSKENQLIHKRKSPKKGKLIDIFDELVYATYLIENKRFSLEILMIEKEEIRFDDGKGSWRRKGISIKDRKLVKVNTSFLFLKKEDFLCFVPYDLEEPFTNKSFSHHSKISIYKTRRITYSLKKIGVIEEIGKKGNELLFKKL